MVKQSLLAEVAARLRREAERRPVYPALWRLPDPRHTCELPDGTRLILTSSYQRGQRHYHLCISHPERRLSLRECRMVLGTFFAHPERVRWIEPRLNPRARHFEYVEPVGAGADRPVGSEASLRPAG